MNQQAFTYIKLTLVGVVLVGGFLLVALGKLDAPSMFTHVTTMVGALVVALGLSSAGSAISAGQTTMARARLGFLPLDPQRDVRISHPKPDKEVQS